MEEAMMKASLTAAFAIAGVLAVSPVQAQQTPGSSGPAAPAATSAAAGLPAVRHLVYRFGYNTKAASEGTGTGTTTIDIGGLAIDGGMTVTATDDWWNTVNPRQSYTCEVYPDGGVTCAQPPNAISPIQLAVVPLLGQAYFTALSSGPSSSWKQSYTIRATFDPSGSTGFAGEVNAWNCAYTLTGKGTVPNAAPLILIHSEGAMKEQGGRYITINQKASILFDPRIKMPVFVDEELNLVPRLSVDRYTLELKLIKD
ncbi:MAG: hypothetical protein JO104_02115 [Candidatus Eremiobacteraeota bacterium]|nr:hypothetical protein [Candidatus Eremiobacteraeota bacterium]